MVLKGTNNNKFCIIINIINKKIIWIINLKVIKHILINKSTFVNFVNIFINIYINRKKTLYSLSKGNIKIIINNKY